MKRFISTASMLALVTGATLSGAALAQEETISQEESVTTLEAITVTANRIQTELSKTGSTVVQISQEEIEEKSLATVRDYLTLVPGVSFTANGGPGSSSNLYIRGLPGGYIKTLYNGIDISDTTGVQVGTHYQYLLADGVTGIELLKGSQSTLYGSSAIAGVVDIATLGQIEDGISHTVHVEGGSFGTARGHYGFSGAKDGSKIAANIAGFRNDGISARAGGWEKDGYRNLTLDVAAEQRINEAFSVFGSLLYIDAKAEFDGTEDIFPYAPDPNDPYSYELARMMGGRAGVNIDLLDGRLKNTFSFQSFKSERESVSGGYATPFIGTRQKFDYQGSFEASERILLQYGVDHERQKGSVGDPLGKIDLTGVWTQAVVEPIDDLVLTAGLRHDEHSMFGGHMTYRGTASYLFDQMGTRLHSSIGTGFRAPSLYELYAPYNMGDPTFQPEKSKSFDIGIEQKFLDDRLTTDLTYFWSEIENLIVWDNDAYVYQQLPGITRAQGVEASFTYSATNWLDLGGSYTYTDSKQATGARRENLPRHMVVISALVRPAEKWTLSGDIKFAADVADKVGAMKDYVLLNAKLAYQVNEATEIYLRGENLFNQKYQVVRGYNTPGIAAYAGFKANF